MEEAVEARSGTPRKVGRAEVVEGIAMEAIPSTWYSRGVHGCSLSAPWGIENASHIQRRAGNHVKQKHIIFTIPISLVCLLSAPIQKFNPSGNLINPF